MRGRASASTRINLERATVLVLDDNGPSLDILSQVVSGFGVKPAASRRSGHGRPGSGPDQDLRPDHQRRSDARSSTASSSSMAAPRSTREQSLRAGDPGDRPHPRRGHLSRPATREPISPWPSRSRRRFCWSGSSGWRARSGRSSSATAMSGPTGVSSTRDRRSGMEGRRRDDLPAEVGDAQEANMSQDEIAGLMKIAKVQI
jgi:hypothetical protein